MDEYSSAYATWESPLAHDSVSKVSHPDRTSGVVIDALDLSYSIHINGKYKRLLRDVNAHVDAGSFCALMGASGAGKSTLLDLLADRKRSGVASGHILIDSRPRTPWFNRDSAYVLQDDLHIATLTVAETVRFAAWTRMPEGSGEELRERRVDLLLGMMSLQHVRDSRVGDALNKGISGGELKRLSIAVEIVSLPGLIFLDEPTSGLDSSIALEVVSAVKALSVQNRTCVCTIHQPSPEVFALFDAVLLLSAGCVVYAGAADLVAAYFCRHELGYVFVEGANPAEFIIDICSGTLPSSAGGVLQPEQLAAMFRQYGGVQVAPSLPVPVKAADLELPVFESRQATGPRTQFAMLLRRSWTAMWRDVPNLQADIGKNFFIGGLVGVVFYGAADLHSPLFSAGDVPTAQQETMTALLFFGMMYGIVSNLQVIPQLCLNDRIYRRELASCAYDSLPYWAVSCIVGVPLLCVSLLVFGLLAYFLCKFPLDAGYFFFFLTILFVSTLGSFYWAIALAALTGSAILTFVLHPLTFMFLMMFSGFPIVISDVPPLWRWATSLCFTRWVFEALMINEYERFDSADDDRWGGGQQVLQNYGFDNFNKYDSIGIVLLNVVVIVFVAYLGMRPQRCSLRWTVAHPENSRVGSDIGAPAAGSDVYASLADGPASDGRAGGSPLERLAAFGMWATSGLAPLKEAMFRALVPVGARDDEGGGETGGFSSRPSHNVEQYRLNSEGVLPSSGCRIVFRDLAYAVADRVDDTRSVHLLHAITGCALPGEMCALMGASGAGKSTLLDVIAGRKTTGETSGTLVFDGRIRSPAIMRGAAYVLQDNVHIAELTVKETVDFAARLRMDEACTPDVRSRRVHTILKMLGLADNTDSTVGGDMFRGISGGELKRLSIAVEIINLPDMIFLDEPTTGLDSHIALEVVRCVRNLANQNRTVLCTIHQPSAATYALFDKLLLLAAGHVIYFGPAAGVANYFTTSSFGFVCKAGSNPADFLVAVAGGFVPAYGGRCIPGEELSEYFSVSAHGRECAETVRVMQEEDVAAAIKYPKDAVTEGVVGFFSDCCCTSTLNQVLTLCERRLLKTWRFLLPEAAQMFIHVVCALFFGSVYYQLSSGLSAPDYTNRMALLFFCTTYQIMTHQKTVPIMFNDRLLFYRERSAGACSAFPFWVSVSFLQLPIAFVDTLVFAGIIYSMAGLGGSFSFFWGVLYLTSVAGFQMATLVASVSPSPMAAISLFMVCLFWVFSFSGFLVFIPEFAYWLRCWAPYTSFVRWGFQGVVLNEFVNNDSLPLGQLYIDNLGFDTYNQEHCAGLIPLFIFIYSVLAWLALHCLSFERR